MERSDYIRYCYECECEGVIPLTLEIINRDKGLIMSDVKMSNVSSTGFDLILDGADYYIHQVSYVDQEGVDCINEIHSGAMFAEYAVNSMNQHDKLTEQNKMLREALSLVVDKIPMNQNIYGGGYMLLLSHDDCRILRETLNISELN